MINLTQKQIGFLKLKSSKKHFETMRAIEDIKDEMNIKNDFEL